MNVPAPSPAPSRPRSAALATTRAVALPLVLLFGVYKFATVINAHYPIRHWLFWRLSLYWLCCAFFTLACLGVGYPVVRRLAPRGLSLVGRLALSFAAGVFVFYNSFYVAGILHLLHPALFVLLPLALGALGAPLLWRELRVRVPRLWRLRRARNGPPALLGYLAAAVGAVALLMIYLPLLTPDNVSYDARWYHLPIAEHAAAAGSYSPSPEGWAFAAQPHLSSVLYTWAFLLPRGSLYDHVELSSHIEFIVFLWTLALVPTLARYLLASARTGLAWVATFLCPAYFVHGPTLTTASDHIAALWAVPTYLSAVWAVRSPRVERYVLFALFVTGGFLTKPTAVILIVGPLLIVAAATLRLIVLRARAGAWTWRENEGLRAAVYVTIAGAAFSTTYWLRNWVWYGNPFYPNFASHFHDHPWSPDAAYLFDAYRASFWVPKGSIGDKIRETAEVLYTYSFAPHDWANVYGNVPIMGSLFTFMTLALPFVPGMRRAWGVAFSVYVGIAVWFNLHHQDRYLMTMVPWMSAFVAATLVAVWRRGLAARLALGLLVGLQVVWGGDVYFIAEGTSLHRPVIQAAVDFLGGGFRKDYVQRFVQSFQPWPEVHKALPRHAKVLLHETHTHLGIGAMTVSDWLPWTLGLDYGRLGSARMAADKLRSFGVTHMVWSAKSSVGDDSVAGDLVFFDLARSAVGARAVGPVMLAGLPEAPPRRGTRVFFAGCNKTYRDGVYALGDLVVPQVSGGPPLPFPPPREPLRGGDQGVAPALAGADYAVIEASCAKGALGQMTDFDEIAVRRHEAHLFVKRVTSP